MRVRTRLRGLRVNLGMSIGEVSLRTGLAKGELSSFERGRWFPRDDQVDALRRCYGDPSGWYPPTVARALLGDLPDCPGCGEELEPDASGARLYHDEECRKAARRTPPVEVAPEVFLADEPPICECGKKGVRSGDDWICGNPSCDGWGQVLRAIWRAEDDEDGSSRPLPVP